ncbi:MAG: dihydropteroate synthase [Pseudohongiellaceae bacterium]
MGILNVTPDSFSDGSLLALNPSTKNFQVDVDKALRQVIRMQQEGALIVDIGGESTRPGAEPVSLQEELDRVIPVVERITANLDILVSVDTSTPQVIRAAGNAGAALVNDVRALRREGALEAVLENNLSACLMHMRGEPGTMQQHIQYTDVVEEVFSFLQQRVKELISAGMDRMRIVVDPGFGFAKSLEHNFELLDRLDRLLALELPILIGVSRKSMIGQSTGRPVNQRLAGSIAVTALALERGAGIVRTHDVAATMDAIRVHCQLKKAAAGKERL